ncbi:hypothetical protein BGZ70_003028 [Mortierella alpina]|uniref:General transcription factor TFIIB n=1 Tax=Mortierella alpina TaxID=64518 RepID=A0A9P6LWA9_MORAP|nr:hypothetical protein BGZ70_003028 [Mortierella alpina]
MSTPTAPPRLKAVVSVPVRRVKTGPAGAAVTASSDTHLPVATAATAATPSSTPGRPQRMQCPGCSSTNVVVEDDGETVCHDCGLVLADDIVLTSGSNDTSSYGLTRVNDIGRSLDHNQTMHKVGHSINIATSEDRRELYSSRSIADVKVVLEQTCSALGLPIADAHRGHYLWMAFKNLMGIKVTKYARKASIACLYLAAKEAKRKVTLGQFSSRTEINTNMLGSVYKDVKQLLLKHKFINPDGNLELDPWTMLDKILSLSSEASIQSGLLDDLPLYLREVFGATMSRPKQEEQLQKLLLASQKCMTLAIEADMLTGRLPIPLAGACVAVAIQVEGKMLQCPDEVLEFIAKVWMAAPSTIKKRYSELKKYMLECVHRLPFDVGGNRKTRPLYSLTGVLSYPLFFDDSQEELPSGPDAVSDDDSDGHDAGDQEYVDEDTEEEQEQQQQHYHYHQHQEDGDEGEENAFEQDDDYNYDHDEDYDYDGDDD